MDTKCYRCGKVNYEDEYPRFQCGCENSGPYKYRGLCKDCIDATDVSNYIPEGHKGNIVHKWSDEYTKLWQDIFDYSKDGGKWEELPSDNGSRMPKLQITNDKGEVKVFTFPKKNCVCCTD